MADSTAEYYKRLQLAAIAAAQQNEAAQGRDPALVAQPPPSPLATAAGAPATGGYGDAYGGYVAPGGNVAPDPTVAGASGSYVPVSGGVSTGADRGFLPSLIGTDNTTVNAALQQTLPDAGDVARVNAAQADYAKVQADFRDRYVQLNEIVKREGPVTEAGHAAYEEIVRMSKPENQPKPPDLTAITHQSDRNRLLNIGLAGYKPLIEQLQAASIGQGPSIAVDTYRAAADDASNRNYGLAASAKGTGGQRAALFQAALGQNAQDSQGAARQAGIIRAQEQQQARSALGAALAGQTNVFGTANLLGDTEHTQDKNQDANNAAILENAHISEENAKAGTNALKSGVDTTAKTFAA